MPTENDEVKVYVPKKAAAATIASHIEYLMFETEAQGSTDIAKSFLEHSVNMDLLPVKFLEYYLEIIAIDCLELHLSRWDSETLSKAYSELKRAAEQLGIPGPLWLWQ